MSHLTRVAASGVALLFPFVVHSQATIASNNLVASSYVFRGLTLTNVPTAQPKLAISGPSAGGTLSAWVAGNVEFAVPSSANALSEGGGVAGVNEIDLVAQFAHKVGAMSLTAGATRYEFSGHNRVLTSAYNTTEVFFGTKVDALPGAPSITANWDVQTIHGVYFEGAASHALPLGRFAPVLGVVAGYTAGQEARGAKDEYFNFTKRGVTHLDLSAASTVSLVGLDVSPTVHLQFSPSGQNTRVVGALTSHADRLTKVWFGVDIGWSHGGREE